jgi:hypothetical protein
MPLEYDIVNSNFWDSPKGSFFHYQDKSDTLLKQRNSALGIFEQEQNRVWLQSLLSGKLKEPKTDGEEIKRMIDSTVFEPLIFRLYSVDSQLRDDGITIIETDQITEDIESISEKLKNQKDSTAQFHFHNALIIKQVSDVLNNLSYEAQKKFLKGFSPYLQKVYILGFLLIILTLIMLSALWLHLFMENLFKLDREVYETEAVKLKDFQSYSQIKVVKAFILLILLMAVPIFRDVSAENLYRKNPLQPFYWQNSGLPIGESPPKISINRDTVFYMPDSLSLLHNNMKENFKLHNKEVNNWLQTLVKLHNDHDTLKIQLLK